MNDVARHFRHLPHDEAVAGVVQHIRSFWEPRMRDQLLAAVDAGDDGLDPLAVEAAEALR
ncbi:formate dehydrogenase subunit delta [Kineosporia sp. A_224]|uniref:formate dehydrogenase subunit delta n=1 Tax=Kineosporia sp. A_224 TaxID=1962180 RepID=UPI0018E91C59|nr:formate dehydrogenase subunit delta [Kineosporia sp. A_224]